MSAVISPKNPIAVRNPEPIRVIKIEWTSTTGGAVSETIEKVNGTLLSVAFKPGSGGTQPSDVYDFVLTNDAGMDVLGGLGANLSQTNAKQDTPLTATNTMPFVCAGDLTLTGSACGDSKTGTIWLYLR